MFKLQNYYSTGSRPGYNFPRMSVFHGIPMENLEVTKILLAHLFPTGKFRVRYRGSRRPTVQGQAECLKKDAKTFSVYYA